MYILGKNMLTRGKKQKNEWRYEMGSSGTPEIEEKPQG